MDSRNVLLLKARMRNMRKELKKLREDLENLARTVGDLEVALNRTRRTTFPW